MASKPTVTASPRRRTRPRCRLDCPRPARRFPVGCGNNHTVTADKGGFDLGNLDKGASKSVHLPKPGVYAHHRNYHPSMHGRIVPRQVS